MSNNDCYYDDYTDQDCDYEDSDAFYYYHYDYENYGGDFEDLNNNCKDGADYDNHGEQGSFSQENINYGYFNEQGCDEDYSSPKKFYDNEQSGDWYANSDEDYEKIDDHEEQSSEKMSSDEDYFNSYNFNVPYTQNNASQSNTTKEKDLKR